MEGFTPGTAEVWVHSTPVKLATVVVGANGEASGSFTIPSTVPNGKHSFEVRQNSNAVAHPVVLKGGSTIDSGELAEHNNWMLVGLGLLATAGGGALLAANKRREVGTYR